MASRRPHRFVVFALEALRLALVLTAASVSDSGTAAAFAAPNALFVLIALFVWLDPDRYDPFRALYAAGKLISAAALGMWLLRAFPDSVGMGLVADSDRLVAFASVAPVALYDLVGGFLSGLSFLRSKPETVPAETLPELVVDELPDDAGGS